MRRCSISLQSSFSFCRLRSYFSWRSLARPGPCGVKPLTSSPYFSCWIDLLNCASKMHDSFVPCDSVFTVKCAKLCAQANVMRDVCCVLCTYSVLRNEYCMFFTPYIAVIMMTLIFLIHILDPFHLLMLRSLSDGHAVVKCDSKSTRDKKRKKKKTKRQLHYSHSLFENFFLFF